MMSEPETTNPPATPKPGRGLPLLVFLLLFTVYVSNFRCVRFGDTLPARVLPFNLLLNHSLYLDDWFDSYKPSTPEENGTYYLRPARGHLMSARARKGQVPLNITKAGIQSGSLDSRSLRGQAGMTKP